MLLFLTLILERHAVLFAGSNTWRNYRHQADVFAMYNILLDGISKEKITLMAYDDIANSIENPFPGQLFHTLDHVNVYPGKEAIRYSGKSLSAQDFYKVLMGLNTDQNDDLLIFYNDHGAPGILSVPETCGLPIFADDFSNVIRLMAVQKKFKKCFIIIEACFSGSIGSLINHPNVITITAAQSFESSYSDIIDYMVGVSLSNEFSAIIMDLLQTNSEITIGQLFEKTKNRMKRSTPCIYGPAENMNLKVSSFVGKLRTSNGNSNYQSSPVDESELDLLYHQTIMTSGNETLKAKYLMSKQKMEQLSSRLSLAIKLLTDTLEAEYSSQKIPESESESSYFDVAKEFLTRFGEFNPNDGYKFILFKDLCSKYQKANIIKVIQSIV